MSVWNACACITTSLGQTTKFDLRKKALGFLILWGIAPFFSFYCGMEMCLIPLTLILLPSSAHSSLPACAQPWVPHKGTEQNPLAHSYYYWQFCKVPTCIRAAGGDGGWLFDTESMEWGFLVGSSCLSSWLIDCLMLLALFSSVGGVLGGWEPCASIF